MSIIIDAHEDIAWNVLCFGRNYLNSAYDIRRTEAGSSVEAVTGAAMLGLLEWLRGGIAVVCGTLFTPPERKRTNPIGSHYRDFEEAHSIALRQIEIYERMAQESDQIKLLRTRAGLESVVQTWADFDPAQLDDPRRHERQIGIVTLIENGDSIRTPDEVEYLFTGSVNAG